jgi:hypothetical protein
MLLVKESDYGVIIMILKFQNFSSMLKQHGINYTINQIYIYMCVKQIRMYVCCCLHCYFIMVQFLRNLNFLQIFRLGISSSFFSSISYLISKIISASDVPG